MNRYGVLVAYPFVLMHRKSLPLSSIKPFNALDTHLLASICTECSVRKFAESTAIAKATFLLPFLAIVVSGQLQWVHERADGNNTIVGHTYPMQTLGWLWAIDNIGVPYSIYAQPGSEIIFLPIATARKLLAIPAVSHFAAKELAQGLRQQILERSLQSINSVHDRVYAQIWVLCSQSPSVEGKSLPKQHELAQMVNTSRESVSRALQALLKKGILIKKGNQFVINQPDQLRKLVSISESRN